MSKELDDEIKMYFIVNNDLHMGKVKIAGQVGHAVSYWIRRLEHNPTKEYKTWIKQSEPKIILKASSKILEQIISKNPSCYAVHDLGRTQVEPDSLTVVSFAPSYPSQLPVEVAQLKLL